MKIKAVGRKSAGWVMVVAVVRKGRCRDMGTKKPAGRAAKCRIPALDYGG